MGIFAVALCLATSPLHSMAGHGQIAEAVEAYRVDYPDHDFDVLRGMAESFLLSSRRSKKPEDQLLAAFGAGIAGDVRLLPILRDGIASPQPAIQAACVNLLARLEHDDADELLLQALGSPFLLVRLEALHVMARRRHHATVLQLDTLMAKVPPQIRSLFPQLYVLVGTPEADRALALFLTNVNADVRRAAIHSLSKAGRDDFLPDIRRLSLHLDPLQQEVCASALGRLHDSSSWDRLEALCHSTSETVRIAALQSLFTLGKEEALRPLQQLALAHNPYAITALGELEGTEETLAQLLVARDPLVRLNASASLLVRGDARALPGIKTMLMCDRRERAYMLQSSRAGALAHLRTLSAPGAREEGEVLMEISQRLREALLIEAAQLPERQFLELANTLFYHRQDDLVPILVALLEDMATPSAIALLQRESQHVGAPLIRTYCTLALFRAGIEGPYEENLLSYIRSQKNTDLIQLRPLVPWNKRPKTNSPYELTPDESSRLLLEAFESLAQRQDTTAVDALLDAIAYGSPHNRYALAGLLIRIIQ